MRDNQRQKVYNAERTTSMWKQPDRIDDIHELTKYVKKISKSAWFRRRFGPNEIAVKDGRRRSSACGGWGEINMPRWSRFKLCILHEFAHAVQTRVARGSAWHGREFCKIYIAFVKKWIGAEAAEELKQAFKTHKAKYVTGAVKV